MKHILLISAENVKKQGYTHKNVLPETVVTTIRRVQQTMLKKVMGKEAYDKLLEQVSASLPPTNPIIPLEQETEELLYDYIQPYLVACVDFRIIYPLTYRARSKSVGTGTDENHVPAGLIELIRLKDQMKQDVDTYRDDLIEKLQESESCGVAEKAKTPWNSIIFR